MIFVLKRLILVVDWDILISRTQKQKNEFCNVARENEFIIPEVFTVIYILNDTIEDCRISFFHSFEHRCVYDIEFTLFENSEEVLLSIPLRYMKNKSHFHGLGEKIKNAKYNCFRFSEMVKLTVKIDSSISNINIC